jgi:hypothetical protein
MRKATFRTQAQLCIPETTTVFIIGVWRFGTYYGPGGPSTCYSESYAYLVCLMDTSRRQRPLDNVTVLFLLITRLGTRHLID